MGMRRAMISIAIALAGLVGAAGPTDAVAAGDALFGAPAWKSVKVVKEGERHPLFEGTTVRLKFRHEGDHDTARWNAECNLFGAPVEVRRRRLEIGQIIGTIVGCADRLHRQDRWLDHFFRSDPRWVRHARKLRLAAGDNRIVLRRHA
jgi:heat shock protein HslJ